MSRGDWIRRVVPALAAVALLFCGCSKNGVEAEFSPAESGLYVTSEGTVTSASVETYDSSASYTEEELRASTEGYLTAFNGPNGAKAADGSQAKTAAVLKECSLADGTAMLLIEFADSAAYLRFLEEYPDEESEIQVKSLDILPVSEAVAKGYLTGGTFTTKKGKQTSADEVMKETKLFVTAVEGPALITTDGAVEYVSEGVTFTNNGRQVQTPDTGLSYIVFK